MKNNKATLNKSDILYNLMKGWRMLVVFTVIGLLVGIGAIGVGYVRGEMSKEYKINTSLAVVALNKEGQFSTKSSNPYKTDVDTARALAEDAIYIIKSRNNLEKVVDDVNLRGISASDISRNLSINRYGDTEILELNLLWRSEREGIAIMNSLNTVSDTALLELLDIGRLHVINAPKASFIVGGNISISTWIYSALGGLVAGVVFCLVKFVLTATVINGSDLEDVFGLDLLAIIPYEEKFSRARPVLDDDLPIRDDIKSLAHMLINRMGLLNIHRLYITSAQRGEGRTGLIANIALHLSALGKKTLLIDCDLKNPQLGTLFEGELKYEQTLNALYRGDSDKIDAVLRINGCLDLLPVILERAPDSFNDDMLRAVADVMEDYDYVLIDAASVGTDAEVLRLNEIVDSSLFVVRCDFSTVDAVKKSLRRLDKSGISVIGGIFNATTSWNDAFKKKTGRGMEKLEKALTKKEKKKKRRTKDSEKSVEIPYDEDDEEEEK